jgi:MFS family permease
MTTPTQVTKPVAPTSFKRIVVSSTLGAVLEWFDFFIFASLSGLILGKLFFDSNDPVTQVLLGFTALAVGYFARPLGGIVFGHFGDRLGRKKMLVVTIWLMGASTVLMAFLPTYSQLGAWSTALLVLLRFAQGVAVGGEYAGAALLIIEHAAKSKRRALYSSFANAGASLGFLMSSALLAVITGSLTKEQFELWGWRVPFLISALLLLVGAYIRTRIADTPAFMEMRANTKEDSGPSIRKLPIATLFRTHAVKIFCAFGVSLCTVYFQLGLVFVTPYATNVVGLNASLILWAITAAQVIYIAASISWAHLSDRIGRRPVIAIGATGCLAWLFVYFSLLTPDASFFTLVLAVGGLLIFVGATWGPLAAFLAELFSSDVRYTGISVGFQGAAALAGLTPLVSFALVGSAGSWLPVMIVGGVASALALIAVFLAPESAHRELSAD